MRRSAGIFPQLIGLKQNPLLGALEISSEVPLFSRPLDGTDVFLGLAARQHQLVPAAETFQAEIRARAQHAPRPRPAGMRLFHRQNIVQPNIHRLTP